MAECKKKIRLLLACRNSAFRDAAEQMLRSMDTVDLAAVAADGVQAVGEARRRRPAFAIIDADLPLCDGLTALRRIRQHNEKMGVLLLTTFAGRDLGAQCEILGVSNVLVKPVQPETLCEQVLLWQEGRALQRARQKPPDWRRRLHRILHHICMPKNLKGYYCIVEGALLILENGERNFSVTKWLYPKIAATCGDGASSGSVERDIRYAVETTWTHTELAVLERWFGPAGSTRGDHPTNTDFLSALASMLRSDRDLELDDELLITNGD